MDKDYKNMKVAELKDELQTRGLSTKGLKKELLERLEQTVQCITEQTNEKVSDTNAEHEIEIDVIAQNTEYIPTKEAIDYGNSEVSEPKRQKTKSSGPIQLNNSVDFEEFENPILSNLACEKDLQTEQLKSELVLEISNLVRPFSYDQLVDMLSIYGAIQGIWINSIKSKCFVHFDSLEHASIANDALKDTVWPKDTGKALITSLIPYHECIKLVEQEHGKTGTGYHIGFKDVDFTEAPTRVHTQDLQSSQSASVQDKLSMSLNEIFKMTKAEPPLYYLTVDHGNGNHQDIHVESRSEGHYSHSQNRHRQYSTREDHKSHRSNRSSHDKRS